MYIVPTYCYSHVQGKDMAKTTTKASTKRKSKQNMKTSLKTRSQTTSKLTVGKKLKPALDRIDIRIDSEKKEIISMAAKLSRQTISQYILSLVLSNAEQVLSEQKQIKLSAKDWNQFCSQLDHAPARDIPALRELLNRPCIFKDE